MVISLKNANKIFNRKKVLDDVSVRFPNGKISVVVGAHGSGKTTLLRLLIGELKPDSGRVFARKGATKAFASENGDFFAGLKIADHCTIWSLLYRGFDAKKFRTLLSEAGIAETNKFSNLSDGMKTWIGISFVVASDADIMIFDEPMLHLESEIKIKFINIAEKLAEKGKTVVIGSQEIGELEKSAAFVAALNNGVLVLAGETEKLLVSHRLMPGASTMSPDFKVIGPVLNERLVETTDEVGRNAALKEIISGYINGSSS